MQCGLLTDSGQSVEDACEHIDTKLIHVPCEVLADNRQNLDINSGYSDKELRQFSA